ACPRAPALRAIHDHVTTVILEACRHRARGEVRAHIRLAQAVCKEQAPLGELRQQRALLCLVAVLEDIERAVERAVNVGTRERSAAPGELLDADNGGEDVHAASAVFLRHHEPGHTELTEPVEQVRPVACLLVETTRLLTGQLPLNEPAHGLPQELDLVALIEVHGSTGPLSDVAGASAPVAGPD